MMLRAFGFFFLVFALLSLVVHLEAMGELFGVAAGCLFALELITESWARRAPATRMRDEPLL